MSVPIRIAPIPEPGGKFVRLISPKVGHDERCLCFSERVLGVVTHWDGGRTVPHLEAPLACIHCREGKPKQWRGYVAGHSYDHHCPAIVEFPPACVRKSLILADPKCSLVGATIHLHRVGPHRNSEVLCTIRLQVEKIEHIVPPVQILRTLLRIWGLDEGQFHAGAMPDQDKAADMLSEREGT